MRYCCSMSIFSATMSFKKIVLAGALGCAAASASAFAIMPAQAACLTTNTDNNCVTYDTAGSPVKAILSYTDVNLQQNNYWQLTTNTPAVGNFSNWEYGSNGTSWTSFAPIFLNFTGTAQVSQVFNTSSSPSAPAGNPFYIRVTLSDTSTLNAQYQFSVATNNNGYNDLSGALANDFSGNNPSLLTRSFTRVPGSVAGTPGPLPLMGAAAAFGYSRKIRKAIRAVG